jgi:hypothetical protein
LNYEVQVRRTAELDIAEAQVWYESQQSGLGGEFRSEIFASLTVSRIHLWFIKSFTALCAAQSCVGSRI